MQSRELEHFELTGELPPGTWIKSTAMNETGIVLGPHWPSQRRSIDFSKMFWERSHPEWLVAVTDMGTVSFPDLVHWEPIRSKRPSRRNPEWITPGLKLVDVRDGEEVELVLDEIRGPWALLCMTDAGCDPSNIQYPYYGLYRVRDLAERFTFRLNRLERVALL